MTTMEMTKIFLERNSNQPTTKLQKSALLIKYRMGSTFEQDELDWNSTDENDSIMTFYCGDMIATRRKETSNKAPNSIKKFCS